MFELIFKLIKSLFTRKDDPEVNNRQKKEIRPEKSKKSSPNEDKEFNESQKKKEPIKRKEKKKKKEKDKKTEKNDEDIDDAVYFPLTKEQKKQKKKKKKEEKKKRKAILGPIFALVILIMLSINIIPATLTTMMGDSIIVTATMSKSKTTSGAYAIAYDFEQDLNNLYDDIQPGDMMKLSDLLWGQKSKAKVRITYINEENNSFITNLPREIKNFDFVYSKYQKLKFPKRVKLTIKASSFYQQITDVEYLIE